MIKINHESYCIIFKLMLDEDQTLDSLEEATGLHRVTLQGFTRCMKKHKIIYVCDWEPDSYGRDAFAVFRLGSKKDKPKYRQSNAERTKRYRDRQKLKLTLSPTSTFDSIKQQQPAL